MFWGEINENSRFNEAYDVNYPAVPEASNSYGNWKVLKNGASFPEASNSFGSWKFLRQELETCAAISSFRVQKCIKYFT